VGHGQLAKGLPPLPVDPAPGTDLVDQKGVQRDIDFSRFLGLQAHEVTPDTDGGLRVLPAPVAGRSAAVAAPGPVAAVV